METTSLSPIKKRLLSLAILCHLSAILVGWIGYQCPTIRHGAHTLSGWYLGPLWLDVDPYTNWELTSEPEAFFEVSYSAAGRQTTERWPGAERPARESFHRLRRLAFQASLQSGDGESDFSAALPQALASHVLKKANATNGKIACVIHEPRPLEEMQEPGAFEIIDHRDPLFFRTAYEASATLFDGEISLIRTESDKSKASPTASPLKGNEPSPQQKGVGP